MSLSSYRRNVQAGATGQWHNTCFPSALEQISPDHELLPHHYRRYERGIRALDKLYSQGGQAKRQVNPVARAMFNDIFVPLGCSIDDVEFRRVRHAYGLKRLVASAMRQGCRVAVDLDLRIQNASHPVGLLELVDGRFTLMSNHVPPGLKVTTLDELFLHVDQPKERHSTRYPFADSNVTILPPS